jgi:hypothetical protein
MKGLRLLVLPLLMIFGQAVWAQDALTAQSGEHDTFSRIVFPIPGDISWEVRQTDRSAVIVFPGLASRLSIEGVMSRLPSGRLEAIRAQSDTVELDLGCDCLIDVFRFDGRFVVIDVVIPVVIAGETPQPEEQRQPIVEIDYYRPNSIGAFADIGVPFEVPRPTTLDVPRQDPPRFSEDTLAARVAEAVSAQLLAPSGDLAPNDPQAALDTLAQIEINTPFRNQPPQIIRAQQELCALPAYADIGLWSSRAEVLNTIGFLRRNVFNDSGQVLSENTRALAAAYLSLGFGAEAYALVELSDDQNDLIGDLAYVVDGMPSPAESRLRQTYTCPNALAFWAVLSTGALPADVELNENAVVLALAQMLPEYREVYAHTVMARLRSGGFVKAAGQIQGLLSRTSDQDTLQMPVYDPVVLAAQPLDDRLAALRTLAFANTPSSAQALSALLHEHMEARIALDDALLTFAGSYVETVEHDDVRVAIHAGLMFGLVLSSYPFEALQSYERLLVVQPDHTKVHLDALVALATEVVPDDEFALFVVGLGSLMTADTISKETSLDVARRMIDVGMPSKALDVMTRRDLDQSTEKRLISARAYLAMGDPSAALSRVANLGGDEAREIKAHAYLRMGQYDKAYSYLGPVDPMRKSAGWIASIPQANDLQPQERQSLLKHLMAQADGASEQTTTSLLKETAEMRTTITALLRE